MAARRKRRRGRPRRVSVRGGSESQAEERRGRQRQERGQKTQERGTEGVKLRERNQMGHKSSSSSARLIKLPAVWSILLPLLLAASADTGGGGGGGGVQAKQANHQASASGSQLEAAGQVSQLVRLAGERALFRCPIGPMRAKAAPGRRWAGAPRVGVPGGQVIAPTGRQQEQPAGNKRRPAIGQDGAEVIDETPTRTGKQKLATAKRSRRDGPFTKRADGGNNNLARDSLGSPIESPPSDNDNPDDVNLDAAEAGDSVELILWYQTRPGDSVARPIYIVDAREHHPPPSQPASGPARHQAEPGLVLVRPTFEATTGAGLDEDTEADEGNSIKRPAMAVAEAGAQATRRQFDYAPGEEAAEAEARAAAKRIRAARHYTLADLRSRISLRLGPYSPPQANSSARSRTASEDENDDDYYYHYYYYDDREPAAYLIMDKLEPADSGQFKCRVDFKFARTRYAASQLDVIEPVTRLQVEATGEQVAPPPGSHEPAAAPGRETSAVVQVAEANEGELVQFECSQRDGFPRAHVAWWRVGWPKSAPLSSEPASFVIDNLNELAGVELDAGQRKNNGASNVPAPLASLAVQDRIRSEAKANALSELRPINVGIGDDDVGTNATPLEHLINQQGQANASIKLANNGLVNGPTGGVGRSNKSRVEAQARKLASGKLHSDGRQNHHNQRFSTPTDWMANELRVAVSNFMRSSFDDDDGENNQKLNSIRDNLLASFAGRNFSSRQTNSRLLRFLVQNELVIYVCGASNTFEYETTAQWRWRADFRPNSSEPKSNYSDAQADADEHDDDRNTGDKLAPKRTRPAFSGVIVKPNVPAGRVRMFLLNKRAISPQQQQQGTTEQVMDELAPLEADQLVHLNLAPTAGEANNNNKASGDIQLQLVCLVEDSLPRSRLEWHAFAARARAVPFEEVATNDGPVGDNKWREFSESENRQLSSIRLHNLTVGEHETSITCAAHNEQFERRQAMIDAGGGGDGRQVSPAPRVSIRLNVSHVPQLSLGWLAEPAANSPDSLEPLHIAYERRVTFLCNVTFANPQLVEPIEWLLGDGSALAAWDSARIISRFRVDNNYQQPERGQKEAANVKLSSQSQLAPSSLSTSYQFVERLTVEFKRPTPDARDNEPAPGTGARLERQQLKCKARNSLGRAESNALKLVTGQLPKCGDFSDDKSPPWESVGVEGEEEEDEEEGDRDGDGDEEGAQNGDGDGARPPGSGQDKRRPRLAAYCPAILNYDQPRDDATFHWTLQQQQQQPARHDNSTSSTAGDYLTRPTLLLSTAGRLVSMSKLRSLAERARRTAAAAAGDPREAGGLLANGNNRTAHFYLAADDWLLAGQLTCYARGKFGSNDKEPCPIKALARERLRPSSVAPSGATRATGRLQGQKSSPSTPPPPLWPSKLDFSCAASLARKTLVQKRQHNQSQPPDIGHQVTPTGKPRTLLSIDCRRNDKVSDDPNYDNDNYQPNYLADNGTNQRVYLDLYRKGSASSEDNRLTLVKRLANYTLENLTNLSSVSILDEEADDELTSSSSSLSSSPQRSDFTALGTTSPPEHSSDPSQVNEFAQRHLVVLSFERRDKIPKSIGNANPGVNSNNDDGNDNDNGNDADTDQDQDHETQVNFSLPINNNKRVNLEDEWRARNSPGRATEERLAKQHSISAQINDRFSRTSETGQRRDRRLWVIAGNIALISASSLVLLLFVWLCKGSGTNNNGAANTNGNHNAATEIQGEDNNSASNNNGTTTNANDYNLLFAGQYAGPMAASGEAERLKNHHQRQHVNGANSIKPAEMYFSSQQAAPAANLLAHYNSHGREQVSASERFMLATTATPGAGVERRPFAGQQLGRPSSGPFDLLIIEPKASCLSQLADERAPSFLLIDGQRVRPALARGHSHQYLAGAVAADAPGRPGTGAGADGYLAGSCAQLQCCDIAGVGNEHDDDDDDVDQGAANDLELHLRCPSHCLAEPRPAAYCESVISCGSATTGEQQQQQQQQFFIQSISSDTSSPQVAELEGQQLVMLTSANQQQPGYYDSIGNRHSISSNANKSPVHVIDPNGHHLHLVRQRRHQHQGIVASGGQLVELNSLGEQTTTDESSSFIHEDHPGSSLVNEPVAGGQLEWLCVHCNGQVKSQIVAANEAAAVCQCHVGQVNKLNSVSQITIVPTEEMQIGGNNVRARTHRVGFAEHNDYR